MKKVYRIAQSQSNADDFKYTCNMKCVHMIGSQNSSIVLTNRRSFLWRNGHKYFLLYIVKWEFIAQKDRLNLRNEIIGKTVMHGHAHWETKLDREKRMEAPFILIGLPNRAENRIAEIGNIASRFHLMTNNIEYMK